MAEQKHASSKQTAPLYTAAGFYMLRAPTLPAGIFTRISTSGHLALESAHQDDVARLREQQEMCSQVLSDLSARPQIRQAVAVASPSLQEGLERLQRGEGSPAQQKRARAGLLRYLIRMSTRPTPFGLFSGVAAGDFADETRVHLASPVIARFRTRPDMSWLLTVLRSLEADVTLVKQLRVQLNQTTYLAGERAVLPFADTYGEGDNRAISLRATAVVRTVFDLARRFIPYTELSSALQQAYPRATNEQIERVLWQLWEHHFLISDLHPPLTDARPDEYVRDYLTGIEGIDTIKTGLSRVLEGASALDRAGIGAPTSLITTLARDQAEVFPPEKKEMLPLQIDTALHVKSPTLHQSIGQSAARIAEFLLRQTPAAEGPRHLLEYQSLFLEKYGEHAEVPLLDLLSPEKGLDAPAGYEKPPRAYHRPSQRQSSTVDSRDQLLLRLIADAVNTHSLEVELTDEIQKRLERWSPQREKAPLSLEIYLQLHAASREAIDRGEWAAVLGRNCGAHGGRTFGRFFDLLDERGQESLRDLTRREEALQPDVIFAELSYQPSQARAANVATRPPLRSYEIAVGTTPSVPPERVISLNDLVVGARAGHFYLRSLRLGKQVRVCQTHMLNVLPAPNACRFITEIASHGQPMLSPFDWGVAADSPFLPRLVIKAGPSSKLVIAPACWQLQAEAISAHGEGPQEIRWFRGLQHWRTQWRVPRYVYLVEMDNRLLLDLENPLMAAELYDELRKNDGQYRVTLDELLPDFEHLWLRDEQGAGYFSEIVVPLLRADAGTPVSLPSPGTPARTFSPPPRVISSIDRSCFPGERWVYLKLYAAPSQQGELLANSMRQLVQDLQNQQMLDRWFFIRYADPEPHLRLRFHTREGVEPVSILPAVFSWCLQLARRGQIQRYALDTYEREVERYGGPEAMDLLEQAFTADSVLVSDLLAFQQIHRLTLEPLLIVVFTLDHLFASWGYQFSQRQEWTRGASEKYAFSKEFRSQRKLYCDLLTPRGPLDGDLEEQRRLLLEIAGPHEPFFRELGGQVRQLAGAENLWVSEDSILSSLAHMHVNRLLGSDRDREQQIYAFWRHTLDSLERRPE